MQAAMFQDVCPVKKHISDCAVVVDMLTLNSDMAP